MTEGMYTGITGDTKQLYELLYDKPMGNVLAALGRFLQQEFELRDEQEHVEVLAQTLRQQFKRQSHSGISAFVVTMQLLDAVANGALTDEERAYIMQLEVGEHEG